MNILINAYACSPTLGSEPGMGWNWISNIAKFCNIYVITEGEWQKEIEEAIKTHPFKSNLHFTYLPVSEKIRKMCWNQGDWRFYYHYRQWQKKALEKAKDICKKTEIDLVHQLNMVGFREPGCLWKLGKPLVWGPIGGMGESMKGFLETAPIKMKLQLLIKDTITNFQLRYSNYINQAFKHSNVIISAIPATQEKVKQYKHIDTILIPETGCYDLNSTVIDKRNRKDFHILWVGRFTYTKRLDIALRAISQIKHLSNIHFHIVGTGNAKEICRYKSLCIKLGIENICEWHGAVINTKVHEMMRNADVFFFTSIREATSTVVPEAINNCLPIVCFNACGFGPIVTQEIGRKIELSSPLKAIIDFAKALEDLYNNKQTLYEMSINCKKALKQLLWVEKARKMLEVYKSLL